MCFMDHEASTSEERERERRSACIRRHQAFTLAAPRHDAASTIHHTLPRAGGHGSGADQLPLHRGLHSFTFQLNLSRV